MSSYDLPDELQVTADGPVRIVTLNRPDELNATNHVLHAGLASLFPQLDADEDARVVVLSGRVRPADRWRFAVLGVSDFVAKPIEFAQLVDRLEDIAKRHEEGLRQRLSRPAPAG